MSDTMLFGVLRMPYELAMSTELSRLQFWDRAQQAADTIERMRDWIEGDCSCPCCEGVSKCLDGCTFAADAPTDAERMAEARAVIYGAARTGSKT